MSCFQQNGHFFFEILKKMSKFTLKKQNIEPFNSIGYSSSEENKNT